MGPLSDEDERPPSSWGDDTTSAERIETRDPRDDDERTMEAKPSAPSTVRRPVPPVTAKGTLKRLTPLEEDDGVTTQAEAPRGLLGSYPNEHDDDEEEDATKVGPRASIYEEDSVTAQAPTLSEAQLAEVRASAGKLLASLEDSTEGTTKLLFKDESESITTQAPAPLTNMLRVIASADSEPDEPDEPEGPENRTAVMASAPLQRIAKEGSDVDRRPPLRPTGPQVTLAQSSALAVAALPYALAPSVPALAPSSESGLRIARPEGPRPSGVGLTAPAHLAAEQPSVHDVDLGKPRYGLLVAVVAVLSLVVPAGLFVALRGGRTEDPSTSSASLTEAASELETKDGTPRGKVDKKALAAALAASAAASAQASASASASASSVPPAPGSRKPSRNVPVRR